MATAVERLLQTAKAEVGYLEKANGNLNYLYDKTKNAGDANYTKYGYEMHQIQPYNMDYPAAWCDAYYDWLHVKTFGVEMARKLLYDFDDYTVNSVALYKKHGRWYTSNPKIGDQIFFNDKYGNVCHTGLVIAVTNTQVRTNEGNTSGGSSVIANGGGVCEKVYSLNYERIAGYGRPDYSLVEEEIDMEELKALEKRVEKLEKPMIYNYIDKNMPDWARPTIQKLVDKGYLKGGSDGLGLTDELLRILVINDRAGLYDKETIYNKIEEVPEWAREAIQWEIDNDILQGTDNGLNLTYDNIRQIVREYRFYQIINK